MSGAGKSNLGNKLLDNPTNDPFEEGKVTSRAATTTQTKRAEYNGLVVIDTPGIPNKDPGKTVAHFDAVVKALRQEGSLNTLLFLVNQEDAFSPAFEEYALLLEQFNHLPCSKLMVCRQPALTRQSTKTEEEKRCVFFVMSQIPSAPFNRKQCLILPSHDQKPEGRLAL